MSDSSSDEDNTNLASILRLAKATKDKDKHDKKKKKNNTKLEILRLIREMKVDKMVEKPTIIPPPISRSSSGPRASNDFKCRTCKEVMSSTNIVNYASSAGTRMVSGTCPVCNKTLHKQLGINRLSAEERKEYYTQKLDALTKDSIPE